MSDVTDLQILSLDSAVDYAPSEWLQGDTGTSLPPTPYPTAINQPVGNGGMIGGASVFDWTKLFGGLATSVASAVNGTPAGYIRDPRTGAVMPVGGGYGMPVGTLPGQRPLGLQQGNLMPLLLLGGLVLLLKRG